MNGHMYISIKQIQDPLTQGSNAITEHDLQEGKCEYEYKSCYAFLSVCARCRVSKQQLENHFRARHHHQYALEKEREMFDTTLTRGKEALPLNPPIDWYNYLDR
jgi:hypothetical protein